MGKKKKRELKPWCWYCDREFEDEKVLINHQKAKHFKCSHCNKKLNTAGGMLVHINQVHKETIKRVPNALPGRDSIDIEIFGMEGVPEEDLQAHIAQIEGTGSKKQKTEAEILAETHQAAYAGAWRPPVQTAGPSGPAMPVPGMPGMPGAPPPGAPIGPVAPPRPVGPYGAAAPIAPPNAPAYPSMPYQAPAYPAYPLPSRGAAPPVMPMGMRPPMMPMQGPPPNLPMSRPPPMMSGPPLPRPGGPPPGPPSRYGGPPPTSNWPARPPMPQQGPVIASANFQNKEPQMPRPPFNAGGLPPTAPPTSGLPAPMAPLSSKSALAPTHEAAGPAVGGKSQAIHIVYEASISVEERRAQYPKYKFVEDD